MSLHCEALGVLISGDMVLPRISTNVSVIDIEPEANPLVLYLDSIRRMQALPDDTLVLPRTAGRSPACTRASSS
jgi:glyoxylase-like metal-dependent hydrolase (beta-lactamase superfamily II)